MSLSSWLGLGRPTLPRATALRPQLHVEALEDRCVPATGLGAAMVADIDPGTDSSSPHKLINADGTLYFFANYSFGDSGRPLYKSDGTAAGTVPIASSLVSLPELAAIGNTVFYNTVFGLAKTDGDTRTIVRESVGGSHFTPSAGKLFFTSRSVEGNGNELWVSDGTEKGTFQVKDIHRGTHKETCGGGGGPRHRAQGPKYCQVPNDSDPRWLTDVNDTLFFTADDGTSRALWSSGGTKGTTGLIERVGAVELTNVGGTLFFSGSDGTNGWELWKSDGTDQGTVLVKDIRPGNLSSTPQNLINVNGTLYFTADDGAHGRELWKSDGTEAGTVLVKDIHGGSSSAIFGDSSDGVMVNINDRLYLTVDDGTHGLELWKSDGTAAGTALVKDINMAGSSTPENLTNVNGQLYFRADDGIGGTELWQSDGTESGTIMEDLYPGSAGSYPNSLVAMNNKLYFSARDPDHGRELWDPPPVEPQKEYLLVADYDQANVLRYDAVTGDFVDELVAKRSGGLNQPQFMALGPNDGNLYVGSGHFNGPGHFHGVLRYDGGTGALIDRFVDAGEPKENCAPASADPSEHCGLITSVHGLIFGPDGNLYVGDWSGGEPDDDFLGVGTILRFDGSTGELIDEFVTTNDGGLEHPFGMVFGPAGKGGKKLDLYVVNVASNEILRYDGKTGDFIETFVASGSGGLDGPFALTFGPDGNLYVGDLNGVLRYQGPSGPTPGAFLDMVVPPGSGGLLTTGGILFGPDGNGDGHQDLYVANFDYTGIIGAERGRNGNVKRYDGRTGAFIDTFVPIGSGGLDNGWALMFSRTDPVTLAYTGGDKFTAAGPADGTADTSLTAEQIAPLVVAEGTTREAATGADSSAAELITPGGQDEPDHIDLMRVMLGHEDDGLSGKTSGTTPAMAEHGSGEAGPITWVFDSDPLDRWGIALDE